ncbi:DUF167 family protein YggU [Sodalis sp. C49]|uniref:DUF167 family protein YggU n=1 Tax=unclassified Sodalis (in: enterobacteria) TaxID=2636512 RepID=UPI00396597DB
MICAWLDAGDVVLRLYIQPKASGDRIVGPHGDEIKVAITAPPVDGQANEHLTRFIAKQFGVAKSRVMIEKGELGRHKQLRITEPPRLPALIAQLLADDAAGA